MTTWQLLSALVSGERVTIKGVTGVVSSVEREDGSGTSFNVVLCVAGSISGRQTVYVKTVG